MSGYTLKLDLTEYERKVLLGLVRKALADPERIDETSTYTVALLKIKDEINDYLDAVEQAERITKGDEAEARESVCAHCQTPLTVSVGPGYFIHVDTGLREADSPYRHNARVGKPPKNIGEQKAEWTEQMRGEG